MESEDSLESSYSESLETSSALSESDNSFTSISNDDSNYKNDLVNESVNDKNKSVNVSHNEDNEKTDASFIYAARKKKIHNFSTSEEEEENNVSLSNAMENSKSVSLNISSNVSNSKNTDEYNPSNDQSVYTCKSNDASIKENNDDKFDSSLNTYPSRKARNTLDFSTASKESNMDNANSVLTTGNSTGSVLNDSTLEVGEMSDSNIEGNAKFTSTRSGQIIDSATNSESEKETDIVDVSSADTDIVDVSSAEESTVFTPRKQITLPQMFKKANNQNVNTQQKQISDKKITKNTPTQHGQGEDSIIVSQTEYDKQSSSVKTLQEDYRKIRNLLHSINLSALPDKGEALSKKHQDLENAVKFAETKLSKMVVDKALTTVTNNLLKPVAWDDLQAMSESVKPKTFGERAMATINAQKVLTMESLQHLHNSLQTCPTEDTFAEEPKGLRVELMPHQKYALAWLLWREGQRPSGGILADDMGLGKTLTMISLILKSREIKKSLYDDDDSDEENRAERNSKHQGGTLVVCPASLLKQWESEVEKHCKRYLLSVELYHGPRRETKAKILAKRDMVITSYAICMNEVEKASALYQVRWRRIILDEAHQVRNYKSQTSKAVCHLHGQSRWALTGTPVHNKEEDMYSLLKFLRCSPFDDLVVWKRWVANKNSGGQDRINTVLASIMLRRTKVGLQEKGALQSLPDRTSETICINLQAQEQAVYQKILIFSKTLFAQYLHQHVEKQNDYVALGKYSNQSQNPQHAYFKMHQKMLKLNRVKEVKSHEILVLLLRLRQMCCHPSLIINMLHADQFDSEEDIEGHEEFDLMKEMQKLNIDDNVNNDTSNFNQEDNDEEFGKSLKELLNPNNPLFSEDRRSAKLDAVLKLLQEKILPTNEKAIVVSQWTSLLRLLGMHLKESNIPFDQLDGSVVVSKRMSLVDNFNNPSHPTKVLLLSLTAGGVGLNLVGGNHMLLLDLHWNPQLEAQAQDRIYRVGQKRNVHIYRFMVLNTIEERIKSLQELKLGLANSMLTGTRRQQMKLTLQDLRMLFSM